jgi:hypothetical protein
MFHSKLIGAFLLLLGATCCLWQFRFVRHPDHPTLTLGDLKPSASLSPGVSWAGTAADPALLLRPTTPAKSVVQRILLPHLPPTQWLQVRCRIQANQLAVGPQPWSDGRLILDWRNSGGSWEFDPLSSVRENQDTGVVTLVARPNDHAATPALRLEHLGASGELRVLDFEATVLDERTAWKIGKWLLLLAWAAWFSSACGLATNPNRLRPLTAAVVWLLMAVNFSFPGPWKTLRSLTAPFQIGPEIRQTTESHPASTGPATPIAAPPSTQAAETQPITSAGRIPPQGSVLVKWKSIVNEHCASLKPLYHIPLLFAPTLLSLFLIGHRRSLLLAIFTALTIEAAQLAFGYSLDWFDALDLVCDALGILLAWLAVRRWRDFRF